MGANSRNKNLEINSSLEFWGSAYENIKHVTNLSTIQHDVSDNAVLMDDTQVEDL
jgi:hypothetical protein